MATTRQEAAKCAGALPTGFVLSGTLVIIEIIYYSFELWKEWHSGCSSTPKGAIAATVVDGTISPAMVRHASRRVKRAARFKNEYLEQADLAALTEHMLLHVHSADDDVVAACIVGDSDIPVALGNLPE